jgi:zinc protease
MRRLLAAGVLLLAACAALAAGLPKKVHSIEGVTEYRLDNGLRLLLLPDPGADSVAVHIVYLVGSRHEGYGEKGMAHLLEHLLFRRAKGHPDIKDELERRGARWNGSTSHDRTNYFETLPATEANLDWALGLEANRMLNAFITREMLDAEMTVVRNEFEMGENSPGAVLLQRMQQAAFSWHNYGNAVVGNRADIERMPIDRLQAFYRTWYRPDNALLIVAGRFDEPRALALVAKHFGRVARPAHPLPTLYTSEPVQDGERSVVLRRAGDSQIVSALYRVPSGSHPDYPAIDVLVQILGEAPAGRLHRALVQKGLASFSWGAERGLHDPSFAFFGASLDKSASLDAARNALIETVEGVSADKIQPEELERARTALLNEFDKAQLDTSSLVRSLTEFAATGDWRLFYLYRDRLKKVTLEDVQRVADTYLKPSNRVLGTFIPTAQPQRAEIPPTPDLEAALSDYRGGEGVRLGEAFDPSPQNIEARIVRRELANGIRASLLPKRTRGGRVVASITLHWGTERTLTGREAACSFAGAMLMRGTRKHSRAELKEAFERLNASVSIGGDGASLQVQRENLLPALALVAEVLREPAFPRSEFDEMKRGALTGAEEQKSDPSALASIRLSRHLQDYPPGHPLYTPSVEERIEWLSRTSLEDAVACYRDLFGATRADFAAVGDFDADELARAVDELFGAWRTPTPFERVPARYFDRPALEHELVTPDKANAVLRAGLNVRMREDDADFPAMILANYLFGGSFTGRLSARLREKDGLSYSTYSTFSSNPFDDAATFRVSAIFAPQNRARVERAVREEIERVVRDGFTAAEIAAGRRALLEARRLARTQDRALAGRMSAYIYAGRTFAWDIQLESRIAALKPEEVNAAVKKHLDPARLALVVAGDFKRAAAPSSADRGSPPAAAPGAAAAPPASRPRSSGASD